MLAKRIIPCLDVKDGRVVKGVNFVGLRDAGDPVELAKFYSEQGADEIVFLDITATSDERETIADVVARTCKEVFVPLTVGGGIRTVEDFKDILRAGADKISINSSAVKTPDLIPVNLPSEVQTRNTNTVSLDEIEEKTKESMKNKKTTEHTEHRDSRQEKPILKSNNLNTALFGEIQRPEIHSKQKEQFTVQKSIDMIRNLVEELKRHGVNADIDEMNFPKSYQIIIKLDKTAE